MSKRAKAESDKSLHEQSEPKKPNHRLRQAVAATALLATAGGVFGSFRVVDNFWFKPDRERNAEEATLFEEVRSGERAIEVEDALVVLRSGVQLRETPHMASASFGRNNEVREIRDGENIVIDYPLAYTDEVNHTWYGFSLETSIDEIVDNADEPAVSADAISDNTLWVNATALNGQQTADELPYIEILFPGGGDNPLVNIDSRGNITNGEDTETPIAVAREIDDDVAEFFIRSYRR